MRTYLRELLLAGLFAALMAVTAQMSFKLPITGVPFTLQVLTVLLAGLLLGPRWGAVAMVVYLAVGAVGVPVFANFGSGPTALLGPTGGYLWSWPVAALVTGWLAQARRQPGFKAVLAAVVAQSVRAALGAMGWR